MSDGSPLPNRTEETPVTGRDYPDDDPENRRWSEIWRAVAEELNANALVSDLATNRLDYEPEDGTLFIPSDGGDWFLGDGSSWNNLGSIGEIDNHVADTTNPHSVTASQADALATSGGTVTGDTTFTNTTHDSIETDELTNVADHIVGPDDDLEDVVHNQATTDDVIIVAGQHDVALSTALDGLTLRGIDGQSVIRASTADTPAIEVLGASGSLVSGVTIQNLTIDGRYGDLNHSQTSATNCTTYFKYVDGLTVENCRFERGYRRPVNVASAAGENKNVRINNNRFVSGDANAIFCSADNTEIVGNIIDEAPDTAIDGTNSQGTVIIRDNIIKSCASGILPYSPTGEVIVEGNILRGVTSGAISPRDGTGTNPENIIVKDNVCVAASGNGSSAIWAQDVGGISIEGNLIDGFGSAGSGCISIRSGCTDASVIDNTIRNTESGPLVLVRSAGTDIRSNTLSARPQGDEKNVFVVEAADCIIADNAIRDCGTVATITGNGCEFIANTIRNGRTIDLDGVTRCVVRANTAKDMAGSTFLNELNGAAKNIIEQNYTQGDFSGGWSSTDSFVRGNYNYKTENKRNITFDGDGSTTAFTVAHRLGNAVTSPGDVVAHASPISQDAIDAGLRQAYPVDTDSDGEYESIEIEFDTAPVSGTGNVEVTVFGRYVEFWNENQIRY